MHAPAATVSCIIHPVQRGQEGAGEKDLRAAVNEVCSARRRAPHYVEYRGGDKVMGAY